MSLLLLLLPAVRAGALDALPLLVGPGEEQGCTVAVPAGDLDGDGLGDLAVGCPDLDAGGHEAGGVFVVPAPDLALGDRVPLADAGLAWTGEEPQDRAGRAVVAPGDLDGDGYPDLAIAAPEASTTQPVAGKVYFLGGGPSPAAGELADAPRIQGAQGWLRIGERLFAPGDLDLDGRPDLLVAAPYPTPSGDLGVGWLALLRGRPGALPDGLELDTTTTAEPITTGDAAWLVRTSGSSFGLAAGIVPDRDGDGYGELLVAAPGLTILEPDPGDHPEGDHPAGTVWLLPGGDATALAAGTVWTEKDALAVIGGDVAGDRLAASLAVLADGRVLLGVPDAGVGGAVYLLDDPTDGLVGGLAGDRLDGTTPGGMLGSVLADAQGLVPGALALVGEPGWNGGEGRALVWMEDGSTAPLEGCRTEGAAGAGLATGPAPDPAGEDAPWAAVTLPWASMAASRDGAVAVATAAHLQAAIEADCASVPEEATVDGDGDGWGADLDCDDDLAWVHPGAPEVCGNGLDDDCDGAVDEVCAPEPTGGCATPVAPAPSLAIAGMLFLAALRRRRAAALLLALAPASVRAAELDGPAGATAVLWGSAAWEYLHGPVATGDLGGPTGVDLAVANYQGVWLEHTAGEVQILPGSAVTGEVWLLDATTTLYGETEHDRLGVDLAFQPSAVGGGHDVLWVAADHTALTEDDPGQVFLFLDPLARQGGVRAELADLVLTGDTEGDGMGTTLCDAGDLDGDGLHETAIGAPFRRDGDVQEAGRVWLLPGDVQGLAGGLVVAAAGGGAIQGGEDDRWTGWRVLGPGDLDGDGRDDLLVTVLDTEPRRAGRVLAFTEPPLDRTVTVATATGTWQGEFADALAGDALAAGDLDGDGTAEILVGAPSYDLGRGRVWLVEGPPAGSMRLDEVAVAQVTGEPGSRLGQDLAVGPGILVAVPGEDAVLLVDTALDLVHRLHGTDGFGNTVDWLGDLDGDGTGEVAVTAPDADGTLVDQGAAWILSGADVLAGALPAWDASAWPDLDGDGVTADLDCDDGDPRRAPGLPELCRTGVDENCDGRVDEEVCTPAGCATGAPAPPSWWAILPLAWLLARRRRRILPSLLLLAGCSPTGVTVTVPPDPLWGEVPVEISGPGDRIVLAIDGEPVASGPGGAWNWTWDTTSVAPGLHLLVGTAWSGRQAVAEGWTEATVDPVAGDAAPPTIRFLSPQPDAELPPGDTVEISLRVEDDVGLDAVELWWSLAGETHEHLLAELPPEGPWDVAWVPADSGSLDLRAWAEDLAGQAAEATLRFVRLDHEPVTCTLTAPDDGDTVEGMVTVKAAAASEAGIAEVDFLADGEPFATLTSSPWQATWDATSRSGPAELSIEVVATDGGTCTDAVQVEVLPTPFQVTILTPADGATVTGVVPVEADITGGLGADHALLLVDGHLLGTRSEPPWRWDWDASTAPEGQAILQVRAVEAGTGQEVTASVEVEVVASP